MIISQNRFLYAVVSWSFFLTLGWLVISLFWGVGAASLRNLTSLEREYEIMQQFKERYSSAMNRLEQKENDLAAFIIMDPLTKSMDENVTDLVEVANQTGLIIISSTPLPPEPVADLLNRYEHRFEISGSSEDIFFWLSVLAQRPILVKSLSMEINDNQTVTLSVHISMLEFARKDI